MSYVMDFIEKSTVDAADSVIDHPDGFQIVCDPKSLLYLFGMELGYSTQLIGGGFQFQNPNAERCAAASLRCTVRTADRASRAAPAAAARASAPRPGARAPPCCNKKRLRLSAHPSLSDDPSLQMLCRGPATRRVVRLCTSGSKGPHTGATARMWVGPRTRAPLHGPLGRGACPAPGRPRRLRESSLRDLRVLHGGHERDEQRGMRRRAQRRHLHQHAAARGRQLLLRQPRHGRRLPQVQQRQHERRERLNLEHDKQLRGRRVAHVGRPADDEPVCAVGPEHLVRHERGADVRRRARCYYCELGRCPGRDAACGASVLKLPVRYT